MVSARCITRASRFVWVFALTACGGGGAGKGPAIGAPDVPWSHKSHEERRAFMAAHVEPTLRHLFQKHDAKSYGSFGCATCHGGDMELVDFRMPNSLYALPAENTIAEAKDYDEKTTEFMMSEVVPTFAKLLSAKAGDPGPGGVTCFTCHPKE